MAARKHGEAIKGRESAEYAAWKGMKQRCTDENHDAYPYYGGRGIVVCERWASSFAVFLADMGRRPSARHSIDRIDNSRHYEPGNCRWATRGEQMLNRSNNRRLTWNDRTLSVAEWSRETGLQETTIAARIDRGWSAERALSQPVGGARGAMTP